MGRVTDGNVGGEGPKALRRTQTRNRKKKKNISNLMHDLQRNGESKAVVENLVEKEVTRRERRSIIQCTKYNDLNVLYKKKQGDVESNNGRPS